MGIIIKDISFSRMNDVPYKIQVEEVDYPIAPLVSVENLPIDGFYEVQILAYIPSGTTETPSFTVVDDGKPLKVELSSGNTIIARNFILEYDFEHTKLPTEYIAWEINITYSLNDLESVDFILTQLRDLDPKTSRGTVTTVQHA